MHDFSILPLISPQSVAKVKDALPIPETCPRCGGDVKLINNAEVYGREYGDWPFLYRCNACDAHTGLHRHTNIPLGTLADAETRKARRTNKADFHELMETRRWSRKAAYAWLANRMGINKRDCHWGWFDHEAAELAGEICRAEIERTHLEA